MDTLSSPPLKPAEETLTELDKHLLKELKRGPKTPETTNEDGTPNEDPHPWKTSMKKWIKTCKVSKYHIIQHFSGKFQLNSLIWHKIQLQKNTTKPKIIIK